MSPEIFLDKKKKTKTKFEQFLNSIRKEFFVCWRRRRRTFLKTSHKFRLGQMTWEWCQAPLEVRIVRLVCCIYHFITSKLTSSWYIIKKKKTSSPFILVKCPSAPTKVRRPWIGKQQKNWLKEFYFFSPIVIVKILPSTHTQTLDDDCTVTPKNSTTQPYPKKKSRCW